MTLVTLSLILATAAAPQTECHRREAAADRLDREHQGPSLAAAADACRAAFDATPPGDFDQRSYLAFEAERIYRKAHNAGGADRPLCSARSVLEAFGRSLAALPAGERPDDRRDVQGALGDIAARQSCESAAAPTSAEPTSAAPPPANAAPAAASATPAVSNTPPPPALVTKPVAPQLDKPTPVRPAPAQRRPLRVAGWTALGVGLGLGLGGVGALIRGAVLRERVEALNATYGTGAIPHDQAVDAEAGPRADRVAIGLLIAGPVVALAGGALLGIDAARGKNRRVALHPSILPAAGLRVRLEF
ncbi:hypothetical protein OV203_46695 [Nannocystis sp. ILAH1]|uniref:hypothetical protein n=1 Tax=Nannocystis sp. ILAH1 TaxID=2996789 RepID=UPI00226D41E5|nr:hypothetical protein [Nannocystis sp. ILAH1]MCY0994704.1 hypothetical protein [Nannocystis sp. ILAH1]